MRRISILAVFVAIVASACLREPVSNEVFVMGDSITWQVQGYAANDPSRPAGNYEWHTGLGWKYDNVIARADERANDALLSPEIALEIMGMNDTEEIYNGGWNGQDEMNFDDLILHTFHEDTCLVVVLPWIGPGMRPGHAVELEKARPYIAAKAAERQAQGSPTVVMDAETLPDEIIHSDGVHVLGSGVPGYEMFPTEDVARVRLALYWEGINQCRSL